MATESHIHNTSFYLLIKNGPTKLGCKGLPVTNTLAFWVIHKVMKNMNVVNMAPESHIHPISFSLLLKNVPNKLGWKVLTVKNTSLLGPFIRSRST
jgi:hypothetical protein